MSPRSSRLWTADPWSARVEERLRRLYESADGPALRARRLRAALCVNYLGACADRPTLFLYLPCSSYDEALAFESLIQLVGESGCNVLPVLVLPDEAACEVAVHRASHDNVSRLLYFWESGSVDMATLSAEGSGHGSHLVLARSARLGRDALAAIARDARRSRFIEVARGAGSALAVETLHFRSVDGVEIAAALDGAHGFDAAAAGATAPGPADGPAERPRAFMTTVGHTGAIATISHSWLDRRQSVQRVEPMLMASVRPQQRIWFDLPAREAIGTAVVKCGNVRRDLQASRVTCYANRSGPGNDLVLGFALGHGCRLSYAEDHDFDDMPGTALVWGILRGSDRVVASAVENGRSFLYCDHAYFNRGHLRNYRIILNGHATTRMRDCPDDRTAALGVSLKPWRETGSHILLCPPTDHFLRAHGCPNWVANTLSTLRHCTDRPIVLRNKPKPGEPTRTLEEDLENCHALVTHSSNAAVEAVVAGIPVFVDPACAAIGVGCSDFSRIEHPLTPDRRLWLANLAYTQFSFEEILRGEALSIIRDYWDMEAAA